MIGPEVQAPDFAEAVVGYRTFRLQKRGQHNYGLFSPYQTQPWNRPEATARCTAEEKVPEGIVLPRQPKRHAAPAKECSCGIYAYFDPCPVQNNRHDRWMVASPFAGPRGEEVAALVTLTGRIEVHSRGMRAEKARIEALGLNSNLCTDEVAALLEIAAAWGVPVVPQDDLPKLASEFGRELGESERPGAEEAPEPSLPPVPSLALMPSAGSIYWSSSGNTNPVTKRSLPSKPHWIPIAFNGTAGLVNVALYGVWHGPANALAATFSLALAAWSAGRRRQHRKDSAFVGSGSAA